MAPQKVAVISESGLYKLIMRSDKPAAKRFQNWVTREVLPALRKDGMYVMGEEKVKTG
ncbi:MAG: BRO family protein [Humidesulfovibrio sp.]|uniref:BRO-N domain-containing protein n=1 Tax=Humidesulfovibrio sp. TaxID=2910988 RepID=UPI0027F7C171|nr:BRO family protein [Humidesulfovibrio sp.]MDQ7835598.1 BRO family protein [Humidesulfovibrio sp.]